MTKTNYWIYPGHRRPVIVQAETEQAAEKKVTESPEYDGFGSHVYRVEEFAEMCLNGKCS